MGSAAGVDARRQARIGPHREKACPMPHMSSAMTHLRPIARVRVAPGGVSDTGRPRADPIHV
jgi:hypothetical protein